MVHRLFRLRTLAVVLLVLIIASLVSAFAASNTVPLTYAGIGGNTVSGYDVQQVHYWSAGSGATRYVDYVGFNMSPAVAADGEVWARVSGGGLDSGWVQCSTTSPGSGPTRDWYCQMSATVQVTIQALDRLDVMAHD